MNVVVVGDRTVVLSNIGSLLVVSIIAIVFKHDSCTEKEDCPRGERFHRRGDIWIGGQAHHSEIEGVALSVYTCL